MKRSCLANQYCAIWSFNSGYWFKDSVQIETAHNIYKSLTDLGIDVILDDRDERPGVKFNDMDLIGVPIRITIGKKINEDIVELKLRNGEISKDVNVKNIINSVKELIM